jgi:hypothetical protein
MNDGQATTIAFSSAVPDETHDFRARDTVAWWHTTMQPASAPLFTSHSPNGSPVSVEAYQEGARQESRQMHPLYFRHMRAQPSPLTGGIHRPVVHGPVTNFGP